LAGRLGQKVMWLFLNVNRPTRCSRNIITRLTGKLCGPSALHPGTYMLNTELGAVCYSTSPYPSFEVLWVVGLLQVGIVRREEGRGAQVVCIRNTVRISRGRKANLPALPRLLLNVMYCRTWIPYPYYWNVKFIKFENIFLIKRAFYTFRTHVVNSLHMLTFLSVFYLQAYFFL
jgi:hypothetical protein